MILNRMKSYECFNEMAQDISALLDIQDGLSIARTAEAEWALAERRVFVAGSVDVLRGNIFLDKVSWKNFPAEIWSSTNLETTRHDERAT